jgi:hypothetical protein
MKVLLSLADNWKYAGGVDQYVDWSDSTPERGAGRPRPADAEGDADNTVRRTEPDTSCWLAGVCGAPAHMQGTDHPVHPAASPHTQAQAATAQKGRSGQLMAEK